MVMVSRCAFWAGSGVGGRMTSDGGQASGTVSSGKRTQKERSAETQRKLTAATLDVLLEHGYLRMSTQEIADRAGVSRGAQVHHYPTKADLVAAASERLLGEATDEIRALAASVKSADMTLDGFLDHLWQMFSGRLFFATLEYVTASRTDPVLRDKLVPVVRQFHAALDDIWREFFRKTALSHAQIDTILNLTLCLLRGMGVQTVLRDDPAYYNRLRAAWKEILARLAEVRTSETANEKRATLLDQRLSISLSTHESRG